MAIPQKGALTRTPQSSTGTSNSPSPAPPPTPRSDPPSEPPLAGRVDTAPAIKAHASAAAPQDREWASPAQRRERTESTERVRRESEVTVRRIMRYSMSMAGRLGRASGGHLQRDTRTHRARLHRVPARAVGCAFGRAIDRVFVRGVTAHRVAIAKSANAPPVGSAKSENAPIPSMGWFSMSGVPPRALARSVEAFRSST